MRIALGLEYDGSRFLGWQTQPDGGTVQDALQAALATIAGSVVGVTCAGRTDRGVHALEQVVHFDVGVTRPESAWVRGVNAVLPDSVAVQWAREMPPQFHARYAARARTYRYVLINRPVRPALAARHAGWFHQPLDIAAMRAGAQDFLGEHDFSAFRAAECQSRTAVRRLDRIAVDRLGENVRIEVTANAFLHHMVRNIAGTLIAVGRGDRPAAWVAETLASRDRRSAGITAPAGGLYFLRIGYPRQYGLPVTDPGAPAVIEGA